jgi:hypothetical protein
VHLWDLAAKGLQPDYTVADGGKGLRAGQALAWPEVPCRGDIFHALQDLGRLCQTLDHRAYAAINACDRLERKMHKAKRHHQGQHLSKALAQVRERQLQAIAVADQVRTLAQWLQDDILAFAGPEAATRQALYDFVIDALSLLERCERRIQPVRQRLASQRDTLLAFACDLDQALGSAGEPLCGTCRDAARVIALAKPPVPHPRLLAASRAAQAPTARAFLPPAAGTGGTNAFTAPALSWRTSTAACAATSSCAVTSARRIWSCCAFSSTTARICIVLNPSTAVKHPPNCSPARTTRTGWRCSAFSAFAALQLKQRLYLLLLLSVSASRD